MRTLVFLLLCLPLLSRAVSDVCADFRVFSPEDVHLCSLDSLEVTPEVMDFSSWKAHFGMVSLGSCVF